MTDWINDAREREIDKSDEIEALKAEVAEACAERDALQKALTGLTCGGSEFFIRKGDRFAADIPACVAWVRRTREDGHKNVVKAIAAKQAAEAEATALRELLDRIEGQAVCCGLDGPAGDGAMLFNIVNMIAQYRATLTKGARDA